MKIFLVLHGFPPETQGGTERAVEALLEDRREQFAKDRQREQDARKHEQQMEAFRKQIIEEERLRLLQQVLLPLLEVHPRPLRLLLSHVHEYVYEYI